MPFGKHAGREVADLPDNYLAWLAALPDLREPLAGAVDREYRRRLGVPRTTQLAIPPGEAALARRLVDAGYKTLSKELHPDVGGDPEAMRRLNHLVGLLRGQVGAR